MAPVCSELEDASSQVEGEKKDKMIELRKKIYAESERVSSLKEVCKCIRGSTAEEMAQEVSTNGHITHHYGVCHEAIMEAEGTLVEMIQMIAKKILDVSWLSQYPTPTPYDSFRPDSLSSL